MLIPAIRVRQWLNEWNEYEFDERLRQRKPDPYFYVCSMSAQLLRRLSGVRERKATGPRASDIGIQRGHDEDRSNEIWRFVKAGYPWASLNTSQQEQFPNLRKPGWLPTAVVANLLTATSDRAGEGVDPQDVIGVESGSGNTANLVLPDEMEDSSWEPSSGGLPPIEIIDGQHRLYAFPEDESLTGDFDLPVVLFVDLDISWQAYLFWSINITPKRINPSMAYDLYPLLRTADWLELVEGPMAYRETRAQELTEILWSHPSSPWRDRIGMLGRERGKVTQAAFVRSLTLSFVRGWSGSRRTGIGGFFGTAERSGLMDVLRWTRPQQAAYLIALWTSLEQHILDSNEDWASHLRTHTPDQDVPEGADAAFAGRYSLLASDQGVRGVLQVWNDVSYVRRRDVEFDNWQRPVSGGAADFAASPAEVTAALGDLSQQAGIQQFIEALTFDMSRFDWRSAVTPGLPRDDEIFQSRYRGGSGYKQVRMQLLLHLANNGSPEVAHTADAVATSLGYRDE